MSFTLVMNITFHTSDGTARDSANVHHWTNEPSDAYAFAHC